MPRLALSVSVLVSITVFSGCQSQTPARDAVRRPRCRHATMSRRPRRWTSGRRNCGSPCAACNTNRRVVVDEAFAATITERGDVAAAEAEYARGQELLEANARIERLAPSTRAVLIAPAEARFYTGLGWALLWKGKDAEAEAAFRTGWTSRPSPPSCASGSRTC